VSYSAPTFANLSVPALNATNMNNLAQAAQRSDAAAEALNYSVANNRFTSTSQLVITTGGIAIGSSYTSVPAGRKLAILADGNYGIEVVHTAASSDGIASYNKGAGAAAFYAELTSDSAATTTAMGYRLEMRKSMTTPIGYIAADYVGLANAAFFYDCQVAGGIGFKATNVHQASPVGPFNGVLVVDNQQSGATGNVGVDIRVYQDDILAYVFRDGQRSNANVVEIKKDVSGAYLDLNKSDGTNRIRLKSGSAGNRGVIRLWDAGAAAYRYAYLNSGAWVIATTEPT
jgi:hypothetical protein